MTFNYSDRTAMKIPHTLITRLLAAALALTVLAGAHAASAQRNGKSLVGRVEPVSIPRFDLAMDARIDTGARNCSLHAFNEKEVKAGGERFVEFSTLDAKNRVLRLKSKIVKVKTIRSTSGATQRRFVIREQVRLGGVQKEVFITLNDRSHLEYRFLVGRNLLRGHFIVDVSRSHVLAD